MSEHATIQELRDRVVLVTGGGRGIGRVIAHRLAANGARLVLLGRHEARLEQTRQEIVALGAQVLALVTDVTDKDAVEQAVIAALGHFGRLDAVIHNAGVAHGGPVTMDGLAHVDAMLNTNMRAPYVLTAAALPYLRQSGQGAVVFISSLAARESLAGAAMYCATRRGMVAFAECLFDEVRGYGIKVMTVFPSFVSPPKMPDATARFITDHVLEPDDVAAAVLYGLVQSHSVCPMEIVLRVQKDPWEHSQK